MLKAATRPNFSLSKFWMKLPSRLSTYIKSGMMAMSARLIRMVLCTYRGMYTMFRLIISRLSMYSRPCFQNRASSKMDRELADRLPVELNRLFASSEALLVLFGWFGIPNQKPQAHNEPIRVTIQLRDWKSGWSARVSCTPSHSDFSTPIVVVVVELLSLLFSLARRMDSIRRMQMLQATVTPYLTEESVVLCFLLWLMSGMRAKWLTWEEAQPI
mmetsp:Transcript_5888/g.17725  ORF Transcript_5888/g.17725 Transcript_5888/m.17725 type:complete len:215 (-) Transcript_5888:522-1166(-)